MSSPSPHIPAANRSPVFATTRWTLVAACQGPAAGADAALESLCRSYWYPIYAYVRRSGFAPADAQDIVQSFFLRLLEKSWLRFDSDALPPGSTIVVPRDVTPLDTRQLILDISSIFSQFAVSIASMAVLAKQ